MIALALFKVARCAFLRSGPQFGDVPTLQTGAAEGVAEK
jgi:hypothetical protein